MNKTITKLDLLKKAYDNNIAIKQEKIVTGTFSMADDFIKQMQGKDCSNFNQISLWKNDAIDNTIDITYDVTVSDPDALVGTLDRALANVPDENIAEDEDGTSAYNLTEDELWQFLRILFN